MSSEKYPKMLMAQHRRMAARFGISLQRFAFSAFPPLADSAF
jgi:hypothetical protein